MDVIAARVYLHEDHHTVVASPVFAGTALEGTEVNGLAAEVLPFLSILRPRSTFYDTVADNLSGRSRRGHRCNVPATRSSSCSRRTSRT